MHTLCAMIAHMKRTNFYYPEQMLKRLKTLSELTGTSVSELIRRSIEAYLMANKQ
jgi:predicted DNA-binding protein